MTESLETLLERWNEREAELGVAAEARSFWSFGVADRRPVLLIHGLAGSPADFRDFARFWNDRGHTVLCALLPGHASTPEELARATFAQLLERTIEAFDALEHPGVAPIVIGQSLGGVLGVRLVTRRRASHFVALAPALRPFVGWRALALLPLAVVNPPLARHTARWQMEARRGIEETRRSLASVQCPLFVLHSRDDRSVSVRGSHELYEEARSEIKHRYILDGHEHVLSIAPDRERLVFEPVAEWIRATPPGAGTRSWDPRRASD